MMFQGAGKAESSAPSLNREFTVTANFPIVVFLMIEPFLVMEKISLIYVFVDHPPFGKR